jgi:hypothetical protein
MTSTSNRRPARAVFQAAVTLMLTGVQNDLPTGTKSLPLEGQTLTPAQVEAQLQAYLTALANLATAKQAYANAVASMTPITVSTKALMEALTAWVKLQFGSTNTEALANFGVKVKTPAATSLASKTAGAAKRAAAHAAKKEAALAASAAANPPLTVTIGADGVQIATPSAPVAPAAVVAK